MKRDRRDDFFLSIETDETRCTDTPKLDSCTIANPTCMMFTVIVHISDSTQKEGLYGKTEVHHEDVFFVLDRVRQFER